MDFGLTGLIGGIATGALGFFSKRIDAKMQATKGEQDIAKMDKQISLAGMENALALAKVQKETLASTIDHDKTALGQAAKWVATLSASVRPILTYLITIPFIAVCLYGVYLQDAQAREMMFILANQMLGWWFGGRVSSMLKR